MVDMKDEKAEEEAPPPPERDITVNRISVGVGREGKQENGGLLYALRLWTG